MQETHSSALVSNETSQKLQEGFTKLFKIGFGNKLSLPKIVVVGDQSAGKSSVIESLSGVNLPRGEGMVTRVPIIIRMISSKRKEDEEGAIFLEGEKVTQEELADRILTKQSELAGDKKGVSKKPLSIEIRSPHLFDLVIIDLPGLVKNKMEGQDDDIEAQVENLVVEYIKDEKTINLVVIPATQDIATVGAIKFAKKFDKDGTRTIGVLTKVDQAQLKEHVMNSLDMKQIKFTMGIYAVRNRSSKELKNDMSLDDARKIERNFFKREYPDYLERCTINNLAIFLSGILKNKFAEEYPRLQSEMEELLRNAKVELRSLGRGIPKEISERRWMLSELIKNVCLKFKNELENEKEDELDEDESGGFLEYGAKPKKDVEEKDEKKKKSIEDEDDVSTILMNIDRLYRKFGDYMRKSLPSYNSEIWKSHIGKQLDRYSACQLDGFLPYLCCRKIVRSEVKKYRSEVFGLLSSVSSLIQDLGLACVKKICNNYRGLRNKLEFEFVKLCKEIVNLCSDQLNDELEKERECVFTNNHYYCQTAQKMRVQDIRNQLEDQPMVESTGTVMGYKPGSHYKTQPHTYSYKSLDPSKVELKRSNREQSIVDMSVLLESYHKVLMKRVMDTIPMTINFYLIVKMKKLIHKRMGKLVFKDNMALVSTLEENPTVAKKREALGISIGKYRKGLEVLRNMM